MTTRDGLPLLFRGWLPAAPGSVIALVHGLAEHIGRYEQTGADLAARGHAVYAIDLRGHGQSPGPRVHVRRFDEFLLDVDALFALVRERHRDLVPALLGHSHGGLVSLAWVGARQEALRALMLTSPYLAAATGARPGLPLRLAAAVLSRVWPGVLLASGLESAHVSRDSAVVAAYRGDPLVSSRLSPRWFTEATAAQARVQADASRHRTPTLLMLPGDDRLVDAAAARRWAAGTPEGVVTVREYASCYHELLNEPERLQVIDDLDRWLRARESDQPRV